MRDGVEMEVSDRASPLRILLLEDSRLDAELIQAALTEGDVVFESVRVDTRADFLASLRQGGFDLILSDYSLPSFDGMTALNFARAELPDVPFIFVSGAIGEERAIETLKCGATDYVLKERLKRLAPSVHRALKEARERAERAALAAENARLYREAQEASCRKDEFLAMLAHELRNPLGAILNAAHLIRQVAASDSQIVDKATDIIQRQSQHMSRLLDDLLDVARVTQGKIALQHDLVDLTAIVEDALAAIQPQITTRHQNFILEVAEEPLYVWGDATRLEQVQVNLLANATKYTPPGEQIRFKLSRVGEEAVLRVQDSGMGIAPAMLDRIFDLFVQSHETLDRAQGGLGVGLTLVRCLVEMHGGQITAHSEGLGCGSEFVVRLPLAPAPVRTQKTLSPLHPSQAHRILIVEDNADSRETLKDLLELDGQEVRTAADGLQGLAIAESGWPDLVLMDIGLPELNGYDVARRVRANCDHEIRLVAVTGYGRPDDRRAALAAGFDDHLVKPINPIELARILSQKATKGSPVTPTR